MGLEMNEKEIGKFERMEERKRMDGVFKYGYGEGVSDENRGRICRDRNGKGIWYSKWMRRK